MTFHAPKNATVYFNHFDQTKAEREAGTKFAQIAFVSPDVESVGFRDSYDDAFEMTMELVVPWQTAGKLHRRSHHAVQAVYGKEGRRMFAESMWSHAQTPSGQTRYHEIRHLCGHNPIAVYVQLENEEIAELWSRLNAVKYDDRKAVLVEFAREVVRRRSGRSKAR